MITCTSPPAITDRDLLAYLDGEAGTEVEQHLVHCAHCRERAAALARLEGRLAAKLHRVACPPSEELGEYHLQLLPPARAGEIRRHLAVCPLCAREVAELDGYLADLAPDIEHGPWETAQSRVRVWIARLVEGVAGAGSVLQPAPAFASLRGADEGPLIYEAGDLQLSIEVQTDPGQPSQRSLLGLLLGAREGAFQAHLWQRDTRATSVPVDNAGNFVISGLEPGDYELILAGPEVEVHVQALVVV